MNINRQLLLVVLISIILGSCAKDDPIDIPFKGDFEKGYFIVNEGPFASGSGTLTHVSDDNQITQNVYSTVNNEELGSIAQSMAFHNDNAYIVINNSHKVIVVNRYTMEKIALIEGNDIENPRYFIAVGNTGYLSNWGNSGDPTDDFIAVIDLTTNTVTSTIPIGEGPEKIIVVGTKLYVTLQGGWNQNNKIVIIDTTNNTYTGNITVAEVPNAILKDDNNSIWVLCGGNPGGWSGVESKGQLVKINNDAVESTYDFMITEHPALLTINGDDLYYSLSGNVFKFNINDTELNNNEISELSGFHYTMKSYNGKMYTSNAGDFASEGSFKVFNLSDNSEVSNGNTGLIPTFFAFQ